MAGIKRGKRYNVWYPIRDPYGAIYRSTMTRLMLLGIRE